MKYFGLLGCGQRGIVSFIKGLAAFQRKGKIIAVCDQVPERVQFALTQVPNRCRGYVKYNEMLKDPKVETVIVSTRDASHKEHVIQAFRAGKDVFCEKPMTTSVRDADQLIKAQKESGRNLQIGFNLRYHQVCQQIKKCLLRGDIGELISGEIHDLIWVHRGSGYLHRWHGEKKYSGGLQIHKSSHTLDLMNWWVDSEPISVSAIGGRSFFKPREKHAKYCHICRIRHKCPERFQLPLVHYDQLYNNKTFKTDGYYPDRCSFDKNIDVEDNYHALVKYKNGVNMSYTLEAFMPDVERLFILNGTKARLEASLEKRTITIQNIFTRRKRTIKIKEEKGGHGGADTFMFREMVGLLKDTGIGMSADVTDGRRSIAIGEAINKSIAQGRVIKLKG
jgi:predicted dehydrogenase